MSMPLSCNCDDAYYSLMVKADTTYYYIDCNCPSVLVCACPPNSRLTLARLPCVRTSKLFMKRYGGLPGGRELQQAVGQTTAVLERLAPAAGSSGSATAPSLAELVRTETWDWLCSSGSQTTHCWG